MGLQTDAEGNFYYAKSARHALPALVPHHGTLLRVSADGSRTDIVATGFRAANGVCVNGDGTFFVTDQEGNWTPKNRINLVKAGGFYGNMLGYYDVHDTGGLRDGAADGLDHQRQRPQPGRVGVGSRNGVGRARRFVAQPQLRHRKNVRRADEEVAGIRQGAVCELPMPAFATGIMRGRFAADGALYRLRHVRMGGQRHRSRRLLSHPPDGGGGLSAACDPPHAWCLAGDLQRAAGSRQRHACGLRVPRLVTQAHRRLWLASCRGAPAPGHGGAGSRRTTAR